MALYSLRLSSDDGDLGDESAVFNVNPSTGQDGQDGNGIDENGDCASQDYPSDLHERTSILVKNMVKEPSRAAEYFESAVQTFPRPRKCGFSTSLRKTWGHLWRFAAIYNVWKGFGGRCDSFEELRARLKGPEVGQNDLATGKLFGMIQGLWSDDFHTRLGVKWPLNPGKAVVEEMLFIARRTDLDLVANQLPPIVRKRSLSLARNERTEPVIMKKDLQEYRRVFREELEHSMPAKGRPTKDSEKHQGLLPQRFRRGRSRRGAAISAQELRNEAEARALSLKMVAQSKKAPKRPQRNRLPAVLEDKSSQRSREDSNNDASEGSSDDSNGSHLLHRRTQPRISVTESDRYLEGILVEIVANKLTKKCTQDAGNDSRERAQSPTVIATLRSTRRNHEFNESTSRDDHLDRLEDNLGPATGGDYDDQSEDLSTSKNTKAKQLETIIEGDDEHSRQDSGTGVDDSDHMGDPESQTTSHRNHMSTPTRPTRHLIPRRGKRVYQIESDKITRAEQPGNGLEESFGLQDNFQITTSPLRHLTSTPDLTEDENTARPRSQIVAKSPKGSFDRSPRIKMPISSKTQTEQRLQKTTLPRSSEFEIILPTHKVSAGHMEVPKPANRKRPFEYKVSSLDMSHVEALGLEVPGPKRRKKLITYGKTRR